EADAAGTRLVVEAAEQALIAQSCDKNFSCYRDRLGTLFVKGSSPRAAAVAFSNLLGLARTIWSMPPDHPAAVAHIILADPHLRALWMAEVEAVGGWVAVARACTRRLRSSRATTPHRDFDGREIASFVHLSRALARLEETRLVPDRKVLYQFSARGHDMAQVMLGTRLDHPRDGAC